VFDGSLLMWLLLPVAAASGWLAARWDAARRPGSGRYDLPAAYFKGLNYLLNEQPDKAIEVFVKVLEVDSETVETHLAVGNLFRRRGEVERATRIHQNLIARPNLDRAQRAQALYELAQDYLKAGLLDRAENLFQELAEVNQHADPALRNLLGIYEQEKEWEKAIATSRKLGRVTGTRSEPVMAQYTCEMAEEAERDGDLEIAREFAQRALDIDRNCARATLLLGRLAAAGGRHAEAIRIWRKVAQQHPMYLAEVIPAVRESFTATGDVSGLEEFLHYVLEPDGTPTVMLELADLIERRDGARAAQEFVVEQLRKHRSVQGLYRLIELSYAQANDNARGDLEILRGMIGRLAQSEKGYICRQCGFGGRQMHWQCPGCKGWNTIAPVSSTNAA